MPSGPAPTLGEDLRALERAFPYPRSLPMDPLAQLQRYRKDPRSAEVVGVVASTIAVGNVKTIQQDLGALLKRIGPDPRGLVESFPRREWRTFFHPWRHRWIRADQMGMLLLRLGEVYENYPGGLEEVFREGSGALGPAERFSGGIDALSRVLRYGSLKEGSSLYEPPPGYTQLFPSPRAPGRPACKRELLFVRWMVRRHAPDLGLWRRVDPADLHIPLDTHVYWIARHLRLTRRRSRNWPTVVEITEGLRRLDPVDPIRFDFALAHTGISGDCPKHRDWEVCGRCRVRPDCDLWRGRPVPPGPNDPVRAHNHNRLEPSTVSADHAPRTHPQAGPVP